MKTTSLVAFLKSNWIILAIICVATWLRVWDLDNRGILFSDAGRDLLVAHQSVQQQTLPLLGIPSSVPRFKQGPVSIWIEMLVISLFGIQTLAQSLTFALISVAAVIGVYEFTCIYIGKKHGLLAAALLATSPLAVANGRVPYHTTALPFALVVYLFSLMLLWNKQKYGYFLAAISFSFLFQFELAMTPLILLIPFVIWRNKLKLTKAAVFQLAGGLVVGLMPQIIFDFTHQFAQMGVFIVWIGHKLIEFISFQDGGSVNFIHYFRALGLYGGRIFSTDYEVISILVAIVIVYGLVIAIREMKHKKLKPALMLVELSLLLLAIGYFIHGSPSEAYFPPFFILLPIHCAYALFSVQKKFYLATVGIVGALFVFNLISIIQFNFFVNNSQGFSYGASIREMRQVLSFITAKSNQRYTLKTFAHVEDEFPSTFDNYRWLALEQHRQQPAEHEKIFYIETTATAPLTSPFMLRTFGTTKVYWLPE